MSESLIERTLMKKRLSEIIRDEEVENRGFSVPVSLSLDGQRSKKTAIEKRERQEINECGGYSSVTLATFLQQTPCELSKD